LNALVNSIHFLVWYIILQYIMAVAAGADLGRFRFFRPREAVCEDERRGRLDFIETNLKVIGVLLGRVTAFAALNTFSSLQQWLVDRASDDHAWVMRLKGSAPAVVCFVILRVLHCGTGFVREKVKLLDDDDFEIERLWHTIVEESEDDCIAIATSFLLFQVVRSVITCDGTFPDQAGQEDHARLNLQQACLLGIIGVSLCLFLLFREAVISHCWCISEQMHRKGRLIACLGFSWCVYYCSFDLVSLAMEAESVSIVLVGVAFATSFLSLILIIVLAKLAGRKTELLDGYISGMILACAILIGFAWARCLDGTVGAFTRLSTVEHFKLPPSTVKILLGAALAVIVLPAWRLHIVPLHLAAEKVDRREGAKKWEKAPLSPEKRESLLEGARDTESVVVRNSMEMEALRQELEEHKALLASMRKVIEKTKRKERDRKTALGRISQAAGVLQDAAVSFQRQLFASPHQAELSRSSSLLQHPQQLFAIDASPDMF